MSKRLITCILGLVGCVAVLVALGLPQPAYARDVTMQQTNIVAAIQSDGSLDVTETRTLRFSGSYSLMYFNFGKLRSGSSISITGVSIGKSGDERLTEVPFQTSWRDSGGPSSRAYSYDGAKNTLYVFNNWNNTTTQITISYKIAGEVVRYNDCAMLYWKYVKENWPVDSQSVHLQVVLPPHDAHEVKAGDTLRFWGHASSQNSGDLHFDEGHQTIEVSNPRVAQGSWAEVRVVMPAEWLSQVKQGDSNYINQPMLKQTIDEEQGWAAKANIKRWILRLINIPLILAAFALVGYGIRNYLRYGREPKPLFVDKYWRDVPSAGLEAEYGLPKDLHPAIVYANDHNGNLDETAFNASVVRLAAKRVLSFAPAEPGSWALEYHPDAPQAALDEIDQTVLDFLFKNLFNERRTLLTEADIKQVAEDEPDSLMKGYNDWEKVCQAQYEAYGLVEPTSKRQSIKQRVVGILGACVGVGGTLIFTKWVLFPFILLTLASLYLLVSARFVKAATQMSAELKARSKALKNWLLDFTALGDRPPSDVVVWGYFMTYATLYGISKEVIENIRTSAPEILNDPQMMPVTQMMGYGNYGMGDSSFSPIDAFESSFVEAVSNATFALSESSDGGGGGGGFSFGGGGGSGGGGGGGFR